jgi:hypothetical protein
VALGAQDDDVAVLRPLLLAQSRRASWPGDAGDDDVCHLREVHISLVVEQKFPAGRVLAIAARLAPQAKDMQR